jgi:hypothetical protein
MRRPDRRPAAGLSADAKLEESLLEPGAHVRVQPLERRPEARGVRHHVRVLSHRRRVRHEQPPPGLRCCRRHLRLLLPFRRRSSVGGGLLLRRRRCRRAHLPCTHAAGASSSLPRRQRRVEGDEVVVAARLLLSLSQRYNLFVNESVKEERRHAMPCHVVVREYDPCACLP